jgi:hypothetical protein
MPCASVLFPSSGLFAGRCEPWLAPLRKAMQPVCQERFESRWQEIPQRRRVEWQFQRQKQQFDH